MVSKLRALKCLPRLTHENTENKINSSEIAVLTEKVEENLTILQSKLTNSVTNQKKNEIWQKIADAVNAVGVTVRTTAEVREKWKSLHSQAKREFTELAKEQKKLAGTGSKDAVDFNCKNNRPVERHTFFYRP